uniref:UDP-N-acetylglucosamine 2-epimerase (Non-hydrolyzing) n=1 Tax=Prevotella sp. GTC17254 TaxID=3236794 RepID=A0AB33IV05_9BACT
MNICIVAGARPNFMKVAPIVHAIQRAAKEGKDIDFKLVYTGSEGDSTLEPSLFADLEIAPPTIYLGVDCDNLNELTGQVMSAFEKYLDASPADVVIVVDDLASTMAAAIVTKKRGVCLAHLVAGTRSFDINMPKEINRLVIDGLSDLLFTAGMGSNSIATRGGTENAQVYMVGNILMDTLRLNHGKEQRPAISDDLRDGEYLMFTLNRKALMANEENLKLMLARLIEEAQSLPIVAPLRGMAAKVVEACLPASAGGFKIVEPLTYLEFGYLMEHAKGVITDSGNVAEEATFRQIPCITLNSYTEHAETVKVGTNVLVGEDAELLAQSVRGMVRGEWKKAGIPERWDGRSAERIVQILLDMKR